MSDISALTKAASLATPLPIATELKPTSTQDFVDKPSQLEQPFVTTQKVSSKKYSCPHCQQTFTRQSNLKSHLVIHSQEKKFTCETCSSKFRRIHDLKRHLMLHTGERPFLCGKCGRRFARGDALIRHKKASGTCHVTFMAEDTIDSESLEKQIKLPVATLSQPKPLETEQPLQKLQPQLLHSSASGVNSNSSILPSIITSTNNSTTTHSDSNISISLPPISNPTYQTASSLPFDSQQQRNVSTAEERTYFYASQKPQSEGDSSTANKDDNNKTQEQSHVSVSLHAQQQIHKRASISSITSPMAVSNLNNAITTQTSKVPSTSSSPTPSIEASTSFSNILSSPYTRIVSAVATNFNNSINTVQQATGVPEQDRTILSTPSPTNITNISNNNTNNTLNNTKSNNGSDNNNSWQIIKMLENRVRALEERLNSSEGRVSFLESQLSNLR